MILLLWLLLAVAQEAAAQEVAAAPDLEIVALQTSGPGRIGDCNAVVARLHNRGSAPTIEAPAVRLDVSGSERWSQTARATAPLAPGATVEVWFQQVPLPAGLSRVGAISDPDGRVAESDENNNTRQVPRDPQLACGAADPPPAAGIELRVLVTAPAAGVTIEVASPLRAGTVLASAITGEDGRATLTVPPDSRSPVLRVTASAPGCPPAVRIATPTQGTQAPLDLTIELSCPTAASAATDQQRPGVLEIETALPGLLQIDDEAPAPVTFGTKRTLERPGERVRLRQSSVNGTSFYDQTVDVPRDAAQRVEIDAPALRSVNSDAAMVEDLRSGLLWTVGAATTTGEPAAAAICESLDRGGKSDWRLPEIDELAFVLEAPGGVSLPGLSTCCLWSSTEHAGLRLTFYLDGGHIYGRGADQGGVGALCASGAAHVADPLAVPERYRDRLPGNRRFRPRD